MGLYSKRVEGMARFMIGDGLNDPLYRRILIRNVFSIIESFLFILRELIKIKLEVDGNKGELTWAEQFLLEEKRATLNGQGKVVLKDEYQNFIPSFRFTMVSFAKVFGSNPPDFGDSHFEKLQALAKRRNDVTHPKHYLDVAITNDEMKDLIHTFNWFMSVRSKVDEPFYEWLSKVYPDLVE